jgi:hypothetical protein
MALPRYLMLPLGVRDDRGDGDDGGGDGLAESAWTATGLTSALLLTSSLSLSQLWQLVGVLPWWLLLLLQLPLVGLLS